MSELAARRTKTKDKCKMFRYLPDACSEQGKRLKWQIGTATLLVTPPWSGRETNPPPLSPDRAIAASRQEVPKYLADAEAWQVDEIRLQTLGQEDGWYYVIEWRRTDAVGDSLSIPVLMSGVAVPLTPDTE